MIALQKNDTILVKLKIQEHKSKVLKHGPLLQKWQQQNGIDSLRLPF
jgi:hypothetical protein